MTGWAILLQWSRVGINAAVFLLAAWILPLEAIGAFALAFAIAKLFQVVHKAGVAELAIISQAHDTPLFALSVALGVGLALSSVVLSSMLPTESRPLLLALATLPLLNGFAALAEGRLRRALRLRALALRTVTAQLGAAAMTVLGLLNGWGAWSLVAFALTNAALNCAISLALAPPDVTGRIRWFEIRPLLPDLTRLTLRALAGSATYPMVQLLVGLSIGLPAAGAFQIAVRVTELIDSLALAPLRYLALPRFRKLAGTSALAPALRHSMIQVSILTMMIYPLAYLTLPMLLPLLGAVKADGTLPLLAPLLATGALAAFLMPLTQALIALGHTALPLRNSLITLGLTLLLFGLNPGSYWVLPLAAGLAALPFLYMAKQALYQSSSVEKAPI